MRWTGSNPEAGDRRVIRRLLLVPRKLDGEWRWLELTGIRQEYSVKTTAAGWSRECWVAVGWYD